MILFFKYMRTVEKLHQEIITFQIDGKMLKFTFNVEHQNNFHNFSSLFNVIFISAET